MKSTLQTLRVNGVEASVQPAAACPKSVPWMPNGEAPPLAMRAPITNQELMALMESHSELLFALTDLLSIYRTDTGLQNGDNVVTARAHNAIAKATGQRP